MKKIFIFSFFFLISCISTMAQGKFVLQSGAQDKIKFKLINNLIVIPVEVNGVELTFLLDTGVSKSIIFNFLNLTEELKINQTELIYLRGLGEGGVVEALKSKNNILRIGKAISISQDLYAIFDPSLNFEPQLGIPIHGIIGYDFLKDFIVEINYSMKNIKIFNPDSYKEKKCKKCKTLKLEFHNKKPYVEADIVINNIDIPVKLLIDSGGSDALWLFEDKTKQIFSPKKYFEDFLGKGLSGNVYGKRSKIEAFLFSNFKLKKVNVSFPDSLSIVHAKKIEDRNGSLGGEILKRFNIILDYPNNRVILRKNKNFKDPFYYNKSGITLEHNGIRVVKEVDKKIDSKKLGIDTESISTFKMFAPGHYKYSIAPAFTIVELRKNSTAHKAGLQVGDVVLSINNRNAHEFTIEEVTQLFYGEDGSRIKLLIDRKGVQMRFQFQLKSLL
jgi:PDZ domain/Aspartyl protease